MAAGDGVYHHIIPSAGSYYLSGNLAVTNSSGIRINAAGVTLDLNGFQISRASGSGGNGVNINVAGDRATVRNGSIVGFSYGIYSVNTAFGCLFEKLSVAGCSTYGIEAGPSSRIIDCRVHENSGGGIYANTGSSLIGCTAYNNQEGIHAGNGSSLDDCTAYNNQGFGISAGNASSLGGCAAYNNQGNGISAGAGSSLDGCTAYNNHDNCGIVTGYGSSLNDCAACNNVGTGSESYGIAASASMVVGCVARFNTNTNSRSTSTQGVGIYVGTAGTVKDCNASYNQGDGIRIEDDCVVSANTCYGNGNGGDGAGIHATSSDNRIEGNNVTDNDCGIDVDEAGNFIVRNSASGNGTNYDITGTQTIGPEITTTGTISSTSPWANFSF